MNDVVDALTTSITPATFWGQITDLVPFLAVVVGVAFGYYVFKKLVKGASHGKAKI